MIFGWINDKGEEFVEDAFSTGLLGPHPPDKNLGGTFDLIEWKVKEEEDYTTFEFSRPLVTKDKYDKPIYRDA